MPARASSNLALAPGFIAFILLTNWRLALQPRFVVAGLLGAGLGALQFLWLPYKASNVNDAFLARNTPNDLQGIYNYTLNAFPQLKWSYPLSAVPDRVVMYLDFLWLNFRLAGIFLAVAGGLVMSMRNPRAFFLFAPSYLAQLVFFLEYRASDIDVFFITAHLLTAVFIGYGAWALADAGIAQAAALWRSDGPVRLARFLPPRRPPLGGPGRRGGDRAGAGVLRAAAGDFAGAALGPERPVGQHRHQRLLRDGVQGLAPGQRAHWPWRRLRLRHVLLALRLQPEARHIHPPGAALRQQPRRPGQADLYRDAAERPGRLRRPQSGPWGPAVFERVVHARAGCARPDR